MKNKKGGILKGMHMAKTEIDAAGADSQWMEVIDDLIKRTTLAWKAKEKEAQK